MEDEDRPRIEAIQTAWNGYTFRSRCETRWAVFFDFLGIKFGYEVEGYRLPNGVLYLPDFHLPKVNCWAEVKPFAPTPEEESKCLALARGTRRGCLLLDGPPDFKLYHCYGWDCGEISEYKALLDIDFHLREDFTQAYRDAVDAARAERFDRRTPPRSGHEPFNAAPGDLSDAWGGQ